MHKIRPRGAPLEYWFVKVGSDELAFLVDWIIRRGETVAEVRVSVWVRGHGRVLRSQSGSWRDAPTAVEIRGCTLTSSRATGEVEDVWWDLTFAKGPWMLTPAPLPARLLHPFDLELTAWPRGHFTGIVNVNGEPFRIEDAHGTWVHYWGRRLPDCWVWVSASGVGDGDAAVEAALFCSRLWGAPGSRVNAGYVAVDGSGETAQIVAPVYGRISARGDQTAFEIYARKPGQALHLRARAPGNSYNDLGEGIYQTLLGDLTVDGWGSCSGQAGLELRGNLNGAGWRSVK